MDWTTPPACKVLNVQEYRAYQNKPDEYHKTSEDSWKHSMPCDRDLYNYMVDTYPPYFGLCIRMGRGLALSNRTVLERL